MITHQSSLFTRRREIGKTGFTATVLGIGDLADRSIPLKTLINTARRAIDAGLNLIDTAPGYEEGFSANRWRSNQRRTRSNVRHK